MDISVSSDALFHEFVTLAIKTCHQAERECPRRGPGRKPEIPDWTIAVLITIAVASGKKTKSAQYRYLQGRARVLTQLGITRLPSRSTYFDRYRRGWQLLQRAIEIEGRLAIKFAWTDAKAVAVDRSLIAALGPRSRQKWEPRKKQKGLDVEAAWGRNEYHGWVWGYGYEVVVSAGKMGTIWPLLASADPANHHEIACFSRKLDRLPATIQFVIADRAYDSDNLGEALEWTAAGRRTRRRLVCPQILRPQARRPRRKEWRRTRIRSLRQRHRRQREKFFRSPRGQRLYARRFVTVEPFNAWFKNHFDLHKRVWHRGADNNRTQILGSIFAYQLLLHMNHRLHRRNGCIKWIMDRL